MSEPSDQRSAGGTSELLTALGQYFSRLRREDPVHYTAESLFGPHWSITKYNDIMKAELAHKTLSSDSSLGGITIRDRPADLRLPMFIAMDPPQHDEQRKALSPGTVLTALMIRRLLDEERVRELDFGRGDDGYKAGWAARRRQRTGIVLADPFRPAGLLAALRHGAGRVRQRLGAV